jgi:hypothetical protein
MTTDTMRTDTVTREVLAAYVAKAQVGEVLQAYAFGCDEKDREALLGVFTEDARATYDGESWLEGGTTIVDWLLEALGGLTYSQHMITTPRTTIEGGTAHAVGYLNAHQLAGTDPATLIRMNARYDCDLRPVEGRWRISSLTLTVGWFDSGAPSS